MTLVIAASLEVEHGIKNLWSTRSSGFKLPANYGQYIPQHYFCAFVCGFPHFWSPEHLWYSEHVPWDSFVPDIEDGVFVDGRINVCVETKDFGDWWIAKCDV